MFIVENGLSIKKCNHLLTLRVQALLLMSTGGLTLVYFSTLVVQEKDYNGKWIRRGMGCTSGRIIRLLLCQLIGNVLQMRMSVEVIKLAASVCHLIL